MATSEFYGDSFPRERYYEFLKSNESQGPTKDVSDPIVDTDENGRRLIIDDHGMQAPPPRTSNVGQPTDVKADSVPTNRNREITETGALNANPRRKPRSYPRNAISATRQYKSSPILKTHLSDISLGDVMHHSFSEVAQEAGDDTQRMETQEWWAATQKRANGASSGQGRITEQHTILSPPLPTLDLPSSLPTADDDLSSLLTDPAEQNVKTPATKGRKRSANGGIKSDIPTSITKTPGSFMNTMFGGATGIDFSMTQMFQPTQVETSPFNGPKSDPVFQRPSPKFVPMKGSSPLLFPHTSPANAAQGYMLDTPQAITISDDDGSDSDVSVDGPPSTIAKNRVQKVQVLMSSRSEPSNLLREADHSSPIKGGNVTTIQGTPDDHSITTRGNENAFGSQQTDRITDSQVETQLPSMKPPASIRSMSSMAPNSHVSQSQYSHATAADRSNLGADTQAALATSSLQHPPFEPKTTEDQVPSSPPVSNRHDDSAHHERPNIGNYADEKLSDVTINHQRSTGDISGESSHGRLYETAPEMSVNRPAAAQDPDLKSDTNEDKLREIDDQHGDNARGFSNVKSESISEYQTAQSTVVEPYSITAAAAPLITCQSLPGLARHRLVDIAAEPSQENIDLASLDFTIAERTEEDYQYEKLVISGSSPLRPHPRKRQKVYAQPVLRESPEMANARPMPNNGKMAGGAPPKANHDAVHVAAEEELEVGVAINYVKSPGAVEKLSRNRTLKRPLKFLQRIARKAKKKAATASDGQSYMAIFEVPKDTQATNEVESQLGPTEDSEVPGTILTPAADDIFSMDLSDEQASFPGRILAFCGAQYNACYPATVQRVLSRPAGHKLDVVFDDGSTAVLDASKWVFKLDLRLGDVVRVELPKMKSKPYVVCGFKDRLATTDQGTAVGEDGDCDDIRPQGTDIHGFQTVCLALKGRESKSTSSGMSSAILDIPISSIKIASSEFQKFEDRRYQPPLVAPPLIRLRNPSNAPSRPGTPSIRFRRQTMSRDGDEDENISTVPQVSELFANMAFAVTSSSSREDEKADWVHEILSNGGHLLDAGFEELFESPVSSVSMPAKSSAPSSLPRAVGVDLLQLTVPSKCIGFTALIADTHSRRAKHMQALALSLPILHFRWVVDCVVSKSILPWTRYLLPAGESAFLSGAVRSSSLSFYDPLSASASLESVLSRRDLLFKEKTILFVAGKGRAEETRNTYCFLTMALGVKKLGKVRDLAEAKIKLATENWDWVYVDGKTERGEHVLGNGEWKVVGDEFVVQTLILGAFPERDGGC